MAEMLREAVSLFSSVSAVWHLGQPLVWLSIISRDRISHLTLQCRANETNQCHLAWLQQGPSLRDYISYICLGREIVTSTVSVLRAIFLRVSLLSSPLPRRHHSTWPVSSAPLDVASCARLLEKSERSLMVVQGRHQNKCASVSWRRTSTEAENGTDYHN